MSCRRWANVAVALLGNFVGGGLLIGGYYAYANDDSAVAPPAPPRRGAGGHVAECFEVVGPAVRLSQNPRPLPARTSRAAASLDCIP